MEPSADKCGLQANEEESIVGRPVKNAQGLNETVLVVWNASVMLFTVYSTTCAFLYCRRNVCRIVSIGKYSLTATTAQNGVESEQAWKERSQNCQ